MKAKSKRAFPDVKLRVEHSFGQGIYVHAGDKVITPAMIGKIRGEMRGLIEKKAPISRSVVPMEEALEYFSAAGQEDKIRLTKYRAGSTYRALPDSTILFSRRLVSTSGATSGPVTKGSSIDPPVTRQI